MNHISFTIIGIFAIVSLLFPTPTFANYASQINWELIVISSKPACNGYHYYIVEKYHDISEKYLGLYQLDNKAYSPQCMTELKYLTEYEKPHDLDLLILVYDREKGREDLHSQNIGGIYIHEGDDLSRNHTIIFCDCSNFEYSDPVWILSHELSHFVLNHLGFDLKVAEKEIHELDDKFDFCVEVEYNEEDCSSIKTRIETDRSSVVVMSPYPLAIGKSIPQSTEKAVFGSLYQKEMVLEFTNWWVQGNISNENYVKSLQILSGIESGDGIETVGIISKPSMVVLFEPPTSEKPQQTNEDFSEITQSLLRMSPFNEDNKNKLSPEDEQVFILWLKTKSNSWTYNEITDEEFIKDLEYLLNSPKTDLYLNYFQNLSVRELINKGIEFKEAGELKNAISYFDHAIIRSIDAGSQDFDALILKGSTLTALQQYKEALIYFDNALNEEPENSVALKKKAFVLAQLGHLDEAKNYFRLAHQIETSLR